MRMDMLGGIEAEARRTWETGQIPIAAWRQAEGSVPQGSPMVALRMTDPWGCLEEDGWEGVPAGEKPVRGCASIHREMRPSGRGRNLVWLLRAHPRGRGPEFRLGHDEGRGLVGHPGAGG